jgi:hypothetical protein
MKWLVPKLEARLLRQGKVRYIYGKQSEDPENVYLRRTFLFRSKLFSIYIHRFMRSDKDEHHDHPFDFLGYIVTKGYHESVLHGKECANGLLLTGGYYLTGKREEGTWGFRRAETKHMVMLDRPYDQTEYDQAPLTIIFRGPYRREWGFWRGENTDEELNRWVPWWEYLNVPRSDIRE